MLNDSTRTFTPYFFSANHCIAGDDQRFATTTRVHGVHDQRLLVLPRAELQQHRGAAVRAADRRRDAARAQRRLGLAAVAPEHARHRSVSPFSAWRAEPVPEGAVATGLHHPRRATSRSSARATAPATSSSATARRSSAWCGARARPRRDRRARRCSRTSAPATTTKCAAACSAATRSCAFRDGNDYYSRLDNMLPLTRQYLTPDALNRRAGGRRRVLQRAASTITSSRSDANEINLLDTGRAPRLGPHGHPLPRV